MPSPALDRLFQNAQFRRDLPRIVGLPRTVLFGVVEALTDNESPSGPISGSHVTEIAESNAVSPTAVTDALALSVLLADVFESEQTVPAEFIDRVSSALKPATPDLAIFSDFVTELSARRGEIAAGQQRRELIQAGGSTIDNVAIVTDFRVRTKGINRTRLDPTKYDPEIVELVPVINVKISFARHDDGDDAVFQLTPSQLDDVIRKFQATQVELKKALASVTLKGGKSQ